MKCKNCGKELADESKFCEYCGVKIKSDYVSTIEKLKKYILTTLITSVIAFIVVIMSNGIIWTISKSIFFISLVLYCLEISICTIIAKKNKIRLNGWLATIQNITLVILIFAICLKGISMFVDNSSATKADKYVVEKKLELSFNNCEANYVEEYKKYNIYSVILSSGEKYYVGANSKDGEFITMPAFNYYLTTENRKFYKNDNGTILTMYINDDETEVSNKIYMTLFVYKDDLKRCIENQ